MGKQFNFLMDIETESKFVEFIKSCGGKILFEGTNINPEEIQQLPEQFSGKGWFSVYLYKSEFGELYYRELENGRKYIDSIKSPVIEFNRTIIRESQKEISQGRLWLEMKYWNNNDVIEYKTQCIDDWYKELNKWIKKSVKKVEVLHNERKIGYYATPQMKQLMDNRYKIF